MNFESQVCSLELSKRLEELGVKKYSLFDWVRRSKEEDFYLWLMSPFSRELIGWHEQHRAFTVAELGEILPPSLDETILNFEKKHMWSVNYGGNHEGWIHTEISSTEADARARMLIYLLENKLMELPI